MNAKSSVRLRLECLETRSLLSAIGLPPSPPLAPPPAPAAAGEFYRIGGQHVAHAAMQDALQNTAATLGADPTLVPDRLSLHAGDLSIEQPAAEGQPGLSSYDKIDAVSVSPRMEMPGHDWLFSHDMSGERSALTTSTIHELPPPGSTGEVAANAPPTVDPAMSPHLLEGVPPGVEFLLVGRGSAGFRGPLGRPADRCCKRSAATRFRRTWKLLPCPLYLRCLCRR